MFEGQLKQLCPSERWVAPMPPLKKNKLANERPFGLTPAWVMLQSGEPVPAMIRSGVAAGWRTTRIGASDCAA